MAFHFLNPKLRVKTGQNPARTQKHGPAPLKKPKFTFSPRSLCKTFSILQENVGPARARAGPN